MKWLLVMGLVVLAGCASVERASLNSINASITAGESFVTWADLNRDTLGGPTAALAEQVRTKAPVYWATAYSSLKAYRANKSEEAKMDLVGKVAAVTALKKSVEAVGLK